MRSAGRWVLGEPSSVLSLLVSAPVPSQGLSTPDLNTSSTTASRVDLGGDTHPVPSTRVCSCVCIQLYPTSPHGQPTTNNHRGTAQPHCHEGPAGHPREQACETRTPGRWQPGLCSLSRCRFVLRMRPVPLRLALPTSGVRPPIGACRCRGWFNRSPVEWFPACGFRTQSAHKP